MLAVEPVPVPVVQTNANRPSPPAPGPSAEDSEQQKKLRLMEHAAEEISRYLRFVEVNDVGSVDGLSNAVRPQLGSNKCPVPALTCFQPSQPMTRLLELLDIPDPTGNQALRGWWVDSSMLHELSDPYCKTLLVYTRSPAWNQHFWTHGCNRMLDIPNPSSQMWN